MEIKKETTQRIFTTNGEEINVNDTVVFHAEGRCFTGGFLGITKRGALKFGSVIAGTEVEFNVMPKSITEIYLADVNVKESEDK